MIFLEKYEKSLSIAKRFLENYNIFFVDNFARKIFKVI